MGEEPGRRRRRVRPSHPAPSASTPPADPATDPSDPALTALATDPAGPALAPAATDAVLTAREAADVVAGDPPEPAAVAETSPVLDPEDGPKPSTMRPGPAGGLAPRPTGPTPGARPAAPAPGGPIPGGPVPGGPVPGGPVPGGPIPGGGAPGSGAPARPAGPRGAGDEPAERGLRGLVGSGSSQVSVGAAMRARDAARPSEQHVADADQNLTIVRRNWVPREDLPRAGR